MCGARRAVDHLLGLGRKRIAFLGMLELPEISLRYEGYVRALRAAGISAELHVTEAGPHTGFPGSPEGQEIDNELRRFIAERIAA